MALGYPHPDMLLEQITSRQLGEWMAYYNVEPFGDVRADYRSGIVASVLANINRKKGAKPFKPEDFMPRFAKTVKKRGAPDPEKLREQTIRTMTALVENQKKRKGPP